jgi:O-antigen/teichoic acid export membrane protein
MPILIVNLLGAKESAYFYIAYALIQIMYLIPYSVSTSLFVEGSHGESLKRNAFRAYMFATLLILPLFALFMLFGEQILSLFSSEYASHSFALLRYLAVAGLISIIPGIYVSIKKVQKDLKTVNLISLANILALFGLSYVLVAQYGLIGVGYAWISANAFVSAIIVVLIVAKDRWLISVKTAYPND